MKLIVAIITLLLPRSLAQSLPQPKPPGPGGSCPHGYTSSGSFCMPPAGAQDADPAATERHLSARPDAQPQLPPAQRQRALIKRAIIATQRVVCSLDAPMVRVLETRSEDAQRMGRGGLVGR